MFAITPQSYHVPPLGPPMHRRAVIQVTQDTETYILVDLAGATGAQVIRKRILSKLEIPNDRHPGCKIYHIELGESATGAALDDQQLISDFELLTTNKGRFQYFVKDGDSTGKPYPKRVGGQRSMTSAERIESGTSSKPKVAVSRKTSVLPPCILSILRWAKRQKPVDTHGHSNVPQEWVELTNMNEPIYKTPQSNPALEDGREQVLPVGAAFSKSVTQSPHSRRQLGHAGLYNRPPTLPMNLLDPSYDFTGLDVQPQNKFLGLQHGTHDLHDQIDKIKITECPTAGSISTDVYCGTFPNGNKVALKYHRTTQSSGVGLEQVSRELYVWSKGRHPYVLELLGIVPYRDHVALVSSWMENGHLRQFLSHTRGQHVDRYLLSAQIADGIAWLHNAKIVHGDLMGENIMISKDHTPQIANFSDSEKQGMGIRWKAPELLEDKTGVTVATDVYALGMTILETLTGARPYNELTTNKAILHNIINGIHPSRPEEYLPTANALADDVWSLLVCCWEYDPQARLNSFQVQYDMRGIALRGQSHPLIPSFSPLVTGSSQYSIMPSSWTSSNQLGDGHTSGGGEDAYKDHMNMVHRPKTIGPYYCDDLTISSTSVERKGGTLPNVTSIVPAGLITANATQSGDVGSSTAVFTIGNEMTVEEILQHLTQHGCKDVSQELKGSQGEYPVSTGGFGDIYRGTLKDGKAISLKCVRLMIDSNESGRKKLKHTAHELYVWSKCTHPNVMDLIGVVQYRNQLAMVSAWMENGNMCQFLRRYPQTNRYLLCAQIADGVTYLHCEGIVHGDIKGANILIADDLTPKISDFGNAALKEYSLRFIDTDNQPTFSLRWAAPELLEGEAGITTQADIYALGMTILEAITGAVPYDGVREIALLLKITSKVYPSRPESHITLQCEHGNLLWSLLLDCWTYEPPLRPNATEVQLRMESIVQSAASSQMTTLLDSVDVKCTSLAEVSCI